MALEDARTIGARLRRIRKSRDKSLQVVADLTGGVVSASALSRIENGLRALDRRSEIVAIANVLQIVPSELTKRPEPAPANGDADSAEDAVRLALMAVSRNRPGGQCSPIDALRIRVRKLLVALRQCQLAEVGAALPALIRDLHTSIGSTARPPKWAVSWQTKGTVRHPPTSPHPYRYVRPGSSVGREAGPDCDMSFLTPRFRKRRSIGGIRLAAWSGDRCTDEPLATGPVRGFVMPGQLSG